MLTSIIRFHSSIFKAESGDSGITPALLTMTSMAPNSASAKSAKALDVVEARDVEGAIPNRAALARDLSGNGLQPVGSTSPEHDPCPMSRQHARRAFADAARCAGDENDLAIRTGHGTSF